MGNIAINVDKLIDGIIVVPKMTDEEIKELKNKVIKILSKGIPEWKIL